MYIKLVYTYFYCFQNTIYTHYTLQGMRNVLIKISVAYLTYYIMQNTLTM